jgi:hypothetical protein
MRSRADGVCIEKSTLDRFTVRAPKRMSRHAEVTLVQRKVRPETTIHDPIAEMRAGRVIAAW